jgi:ATP phosphoribosyltransferase regulatory subunit
LFLDLGEFRGFDYYDGVVFDVFADGVGVELGGGGRYDHLIGRFGRNIPSTGFALNVDRLFQGLNLSGKASEIARVDVLVVGLRASAKTLISVAGQLRQSGKRVVQQILSTSAKDLIGAATEAGLRAQTDTIIVVDADGAKRDQVLVIRQETRQGTGSGNGRPRINKKTTSITDLVARMCRAPAGAERAG